MTADGGIDTHQQTADGVRAVVRRLYVHSQLLIRLPLDGRQLEPCRLNRQTVFRLANQLLAPGNELVTLRK